MAQSPSNAPELTGKTAGKRRGLLVGFALLAIYFSYVGCFLGTVGSNDGSHFALVRAIAQHARYQIGDGRVYALGDVATDPRAADDASAPIYSNKPPGTALVAVPFNWIGEFADGLLSRFPPPQDDARLRNPFYSEASKYGYTGTFAEFRDIYRRDWPRQNSVNLAPALAGVASCALIYGLARQLGAGFAASMAAMLRGAFGTLQWRYSTALFSHMFSAAILTGQVYWLATGGAWRSTAGAFVWGLLLGYSGLVEYQALLTAPVVGVYWLWHAARELERPVFLNRFAAVALGTLLPLGYLASYQYACFGDPLQTTVTRSVHFEYASSPETMLTGSPGRALRCLLVGSPPGAGEDYKGQGLLKTSPVLLLGLFGLLLCRRGSHRLGLLALLLIMGHTGLIAYVPHPMGGATYDARYLLRVVPLMVVGVALVTDAAGRARRGWLRGLVWGVLGLLAAVSVVNAVDMMGKFQRHDIFLPGYPSKVHLEYRLLVCLDRLGNWPEFFAAVGDLFAALGWLTRACYANLGNWPLFLVAGALAGVIAAGAWGGQVLLGQQRAR